MKRLIPILFATLALPLFGSDGEQSYISYDDGQTIIRQGYDGREVEAQLNVPVFSGDELITGRRGRTEVRLADGNVVAMDRETAVRFMSLANSYDSGENRSVIELRNGTAIIHLLEATDHSLRLDTNAASYVALTEGIYSVATNPGGLDEITILSGSVEIRTPERAYRLRAGETARVAADGLHDIQGASGRESSFERWYLGRAERYTGGSSRYLESRYSHVERDLDDHGDWVYVGEFGWVWRPYVTAGWRPYYNGRWHYGPTGSLIWASYEPWGWYPYHYGRWANYGRHGWIWVPGYTYSPAWVYWTYGPSYIGWAPIGWYSCYQPYRPWYWDSRRHFSVGVGFYGRIQLGNADLSGWTFLDSGAIVSHRVDRAALTVDAVRERIARGGGSAVFSSGSVRFSRDDIKDPASAIGRVARGVVGGGTGTERSGSLADLTPFFRRDPELSPEVRTRIDRSNLSESVRRAVTPTPIEGPSPRTASGPTGTGRDIESIRGGVVNRPAPVTETDRGAETSRTWRDRTQGTTRPAPVSGGSQIDRPAAGATAPAPRGTAPRVIRREPEASTAPAPTPRPTPEATSPDPRRNDDASWRGRVVRPEPERTPEPAPERSWTTGSRPAPERSWATEPKPDQNPATPAPERQWRNSPTYRSETGREGDGANSTRSQDTSSAPIPRRVIDRIGGARMVPDRDSSSTPSGSSSSRGSVVAPRAPSSSSSVSRPAPAPRSSSTSRPSSAPSRSSTKGSSPAPSRSSSASRPAPSSQSSSSSKSSESSRSSNVRRD